MKALDDATVLDDISKATQGASQPAHGLGSLVADAGSGRGARMLQMCLSDQNFLSKDVSGKMIVEDGTVYRILGFVRNELKFGNNATGFNTFILSKVATVKTVKNNMKTKGLVGKRWIPARKAREGPELERNVPRH